LPHSRKQAVGSLSRQGGMAAADVQQACQVLSDPEFFSFGDAASSDARAMVAAALPYACGEHSYQKEMLSLATGFLQSAGAAARSEAAALGEAAGKAEDAIREAQELAEAAQKKLEAAHADVEAKTDALLRQNSKVEEAQVDDENTAHELKLASETRDAAAAAKSSADSAILLVDAFEAGDLPEETTELLEILSLARAEKALLETVPALLKLRPEARGEFDAMALVMLKEVLSTYLQDLVIQLDQAELELKDVSSEALGCEALKEVEEERAAVAYTAVATAKEAKEAATSAADAAKAAVGEREADRSQHLMNQVLATDRAEKADAAERLLKPPAADEVMADAKQAAEGMSDVLMAVPRPLSAP